MEARLLEAEASREEARGQCKFYEEELKAKKNIMAEMINLIWSHGQADFMNDIDALMTETPVA